MSGEGGWQREMRCDTSPAAVPPLADRWGDMNHSAVSGVVLGFILRLLHPRALCILPEVRALAASDAWH